MVQGTMIDFAGMIRRGAVAALMPLAMFATTPAVAQVQEIDPDAAIDGDLSQPEPQSDASTTDVPSYEDRTMDLPPEAASPEQDPYASPATQSPTGESSPATEAAPAAEAADSSTTYKEDDLIGAAEGLFGKGAEGLARMIEDLLAKQGEPNAYIVGREGGGAFIVGVRYGSGTLYHKVEGQKPVYWTGPSIGFDAGANAGNTFILVYNLWDTEDLYERFPAGEGQAYVVGGLTASYLRKGDIVMIPIRMGAGLRLGVNAGYMKFSKKQRWLPF
ncbi:DUF1134 domain-containing protein [Altericroceibacterium spongiae]|uniref:DUF1134 domain-containing protein n=1 Tax=Altericroceibacterium spongiae TaxID=2320269 RepID=A0A420EJ89_9SPHN|nr:DUF1134 domain-containing protein [Altericroceibacterium spongiae]RKF20775.1 DUF1134 domain-containing protein [Altericroceibacterium spongiae]